MKAFDVLSESQTFVTEQYFNKTNQLVESVCVDLTADQRSIVEGIYNEWRPLIEASLSPDQIQKIFTDVETGATAAGGNRTIIGQGKDVAAKANEIINKAGKWVQNTTPVQNFDQKFENLKTQVSQKFPEIADKLTKMGNWAKANPGKTAAVIGILTTLASLAGGPMGGAIAGQVLRGSVELLKGEKLSTAVGHGLKAAALGYLAGKSFEVIGQAVSKGADFVKDAMYPELYHLRLMKNSTAIGLNQIDIIGRPEDLKPIEDAWDQVGELINQGDVGEAAKLMVQIKDQAEAFQTPQYFAKLVADADARDAFANTTKTAVDIIDGIGAAMQGAATGYTGFDKSGKPVKGKTAESKQLTATQINAMFEQCSKQSQLLSEGPLDTIKGMAAKGIGAVANKAKQVGHNLTTKITADKLNAAWKKAGSPTDSNAVAQVLRSAGVSDQVLAPIYKSLKLQLPKAATQQPATATTANQQAPAAATTPQTTDRLDYKTLQSAVAQLRTRDAQSLLKFIDSISIPAATPQQKQTVQPTNATTTASTDKFDTNTGDLTPAYKEKLKQKISSLNQTPQTAAPATQAAPKQTTGQVAAAAAQGGQNPEKAATDAMAAKNPNLAKMMSVEKGAGQNPAKKPIKITKTSPRVKPASVQTASKENYGNKLAESLETKLKEISEKR